MLCLPHFFFFYLFECMSSTYLSFFLFYFFSSTYSLLPCLLKSLRRVKRQKLLAGKFTWVEFRYFSNQVAKMAMLSYLNYWIQMGREVRFWIFNIWGFTFQTKLQRWPSFPILIIESKWVEKSDFESSIFEVFGPD